MNACSLHLDTGKTGTYSCLRRSGKQGRRLGLGSNSILETKLRLLLRERLPKKKTPEVRDSEQYWKVEVGLGDGTRPDEEVQGEGPTRREALGVLGREAQLASRE